MWARPTSWIHTLFLRGVTTGDEHNSRSTAADRRQGLCLVSRHGAVVSPGRLDRDVDARARLRALDAQVRARDPDRWLAARFAPADARRRLTAVYAVHDELVRAAHAASEPMIAAIRLAWWRETIEGLDTPAIAGRHDAAWALAAALAQGPAPERATLIALAQARARDAEPEPFADMDAVTAHVDATAGRLACVAAACLLPAAAISPDARAAIAAAGRAWGLTAMARGFGAALRRGRAPVPSSVVRALGTRTAALAADPEMARAALAPLLDAAATAHRDARARVAHAPAALWPAIAPAALVPGYLARLAAPDHDPRRLDGGRPLVVRQCVLIAAAVAGRV